MAQAAYSVDQSATRGLSSPVESYADFGSGSTGRATYWKMEVKACEKEMEKWRERATKVVNRYRDNRAEQGIGTNVKKYNMLWSIINTTMPAVYGRPPQPIVMRRFTDPDQVARVAALILERGLDFQLQFQSDFHPAIKNALQDRLLPGMGCAWVRYQKAQESPTGTLDNDYYARLAGNVAAVDFVYWEDFGFVPSRTWEEVPAVWRIVYMTRDELKARFPKDGEKIPLDYVPARHPAAGGGSSSMETDEPKHGVFKQAKIYEIWDKRTSKVCWISLQWPDLLDEKADPMEFPGFFPCPKPLFATNTTGNLVPVPDYVMYQDQAQEIDDLTQRLTMLVRACKVVGLYDGSQESIQRLFTEAVDNQLISVDTWAAFAEKGGLKGTMELVPLDTIIVVIEKLFNVRQQLIQDIYQITGLSDIIRGASNPNETLGAQKIKAQFASVRLDALKQDLARFVTDILRLMGHVMVKFFDDKTLVMQSSIMQSPDGQKAVKDAQAAMMARMQAVAPPPQAGPPPPGGMLPSAPNVVPMPGVVPPPMGPPPAANVIQQALQLLRQGQLADYRIEIDSDTLIQPDLDAERAARNEFITGITQFLQQALPAVEQNPAFAPVAEALLMFGIRGFRVGRDIEGVIEAAFQDMKANPQPPKPDPKMMAVQGKLQIDQQRAQNDQAKMQGDLAAQAQEMQMKMKEMQDELVLQREKQQGELQAFREKTMAEVQAILIKAQVTAQTMRDKAAQDATIASAKMQGDIVQGAQEMAQADAQHQQDMAQSSQQHQQNLQQAKETNQNELDIAHEQSESAAERKAEGE